MLIATKQVRTSKKRAANAKRMKKQKTKRHQKRQLHMSWSVARTIGWLLSRNSSTELVRLVCVSICAHQMTAAKEITANARSQLPLQNKKKIHGMNGQFDSTFAFCLQFILYNVFPLGFSTFHTSPSRINYLYFYHRKYCLSIFDWIAIFGLKPMHRRD